MGVIPWGERREAVARGVFAPFDARASLVFAAVGAILGLGTIVVILLESG